MNKKPPRRTALAALLSATLSGTAMADNPVVILETTKGDLTVELYADRSPKTVENFLDLVDAGFYDGLIFHRVIAGFVIQAGGHTEDMEYRDAPRTVVNESANRVDNDRYTLSMARTSDPDSAGAQFYVNLRRQRQPQLPARPPGIHRVRTSHRRHGSGPRDRGRGDDGEDRHAGRSGRGSHHQQGVSPLTGRGIMACVGSRSPRYP